MWCPFTIVERRAGHVDVVFASDYIDLTINEVNTGNIPLTGILVVVDDSSNDIAALVALPNDGNDDDNIL